jgi:hypothetical protein
MSSAYLSPLTLTTRARDWGGSQLWNTSTLVALHTSRQICLGPLRRRDMHKLRRERVRRNVDSDGCRFEKQCAFNRLHRVSRPQTRTLYVARLPQATFDEESGRTVCSRKAHSTLPLARTPISMSFGLFNTYVVYFLSQYLLRE